MHDMIQTSIDTEFKKATGTDSSSDFECDDDEVEYIEYHIDQVENRIQVASHLRGDTTGAWSKVGTTVMSGHLSRPSDMLCG
jgi:hypothetical protein